MMNTIPTGNKLAGESFHIESLNYIPLTKQPVAYSRPYVMSSNAEIPQLVADRLHRGKGAGGLLNHSMLADVSSLIINPSTVGYKTQIDEDWMKQERYVFILKVISISPIGRINSYIVGYTNEDGISRGIGDYAHANPDMMHYATSVIETVGEPGHESLQRYYNIVTDNTTDGIGLIRPKDVIERLNSQKSARFLASTYAHQGAGNPYGDLGGGFDAFNSPYPNDPLNPNNVGDGLECGYDLDGNPVYDAGVYNPSNDPLNPLHDVSVEVISTSSKLTKFQDYAEISNVKNNNPLNYLTNVLNRGIRDITLSKTDSGLDVNDIGYSVSDIGNDFEETELRRNRFLTYVSSLHGWSGPKGVFSFNDLLIVDARGANDFVLGLPIPEALSMELGDAPHMGGGEYWHGQDPITLMAWSMLQSGIAIAAQTGFSVIAMEISTGGLFVNPESSVIIRNAHSFTSLNASDSTTLLDIARHRFYNEVLFPETRGGNTNIYGRLHINMAGDSKIYLEVNGGYGTWYTLPTSVNSLLIPTIGSDMSLLNTTTNRFGNFINEITGVNNY